MSGPPSFSFSSSGFILFIPGAHPFSPASPTFTNCRAPNPSRRLGNFYILRFSLLKFLSFLSIQQCRTIHLKLMEGGSLPQVFQPWSWNGHLKRGTITRSHLGDILTITMGHWQLTNSDDPPSHGTNLGSWTSPPKIQNGTPQREGGKSVAVWCLTPWKINGFWTQNWSWMEDVFPFQMDDFQVWYVSFPGCIQSSGQQLFQRCSLFTD